MLRTAPVLLLLLALAGCGGSGADAKDDADPAASTPVAKLGACRALTPADVGRSANHSPTVDCAQKHTAQTFAVGSFPDQVAADGVDGKQLGRYVYDRCEKGFARFVGADASLLLRSTLSWSWFRPTASDWKSGSRTWRCDVVGGDEKSKRLLTLPTTAKGLLLRRPDDRWLSCVDGPNVNGSPKVPCDQPHTWRAVTTIVLGKADDRYPGDRLSQVRTRDFCSDSVGAWLNYPVDYSYGYTWFHRAEWEAGNRRSICWAKTDQ